MTIECPRCKAETRVYKTAKIDFNRVRRYRKCRAFNCQYQFTTLERLTKRGDFLLKAKS
ncbi:MAG: hypothetical protein ACE5I1_17485 [bacterium]